MSTTDEPDRAELASLAAEVAELLRFEHDTGAIGVMELASPVRTRDVSPPSPASPAPASRSAPAFTVPSKARAAPSPPAPPAPATGGADLDALLAQARKARAPSRATAAIEAPAGDAASAGPAPSAPAVSAAVSAPAVSGAASAAGPIVRSADPGRLTVLGSLAREAAACTACRLHETRTKSVFSRGSAEAELVFVGEGPGFNEDKQGEPFVGAAGQLLDKMISAMGLGRDAVYICNVVKCRPPENRTPLPDESAACSRFLEGQLTAIGPRVIVALGRCAAERLGCVEAGRSWRGSWGEHRGVPVMPTYHPAYLLRNAEMKRPVWEDLQKVTARLRGSGS
ncbi:MAG: uracil-DNA glycosylase [Sandaracinus sp.]